MAEKKEHKHSIVDSLDRNNMDIYPFFSYLLQDIEEIGSSSDVILNLIQKNCKEKPTERLNIIDLGCGKGSVSVKLAQALNCIINGIDIYSIFIENARELAAKNKVGEKCEFEVGDIRVKIRDKKDFDIALLGSTGHVLGNLENTLKLVKICIKETGIIILDEAYRTEVTELSHNHYYTREELSKQINNCGLKIIDEYLFGIEELQEKNIFICDAIEIRAKELIQKFPNRKRLFEDYLDSQKLENEILENHVKCVTWVLK